MYGCRNDFIATCKGHDKISKVGDLIFTNPSIWKSVSTLKDYSNGILNMTDVLICLLYTSDAADE